MATQRTFPELTAAINAESYQWLYDNARPYSDAVEAAVKSGGQPETIYRYILDQVGQHRQPLALRCRQAAAYLQTAGEG